MILIVSTLVLCRYWGNSQ